jgi:hypothetical protein
VGLGRVGACGGAGFYVVEADTRSRLLAPGFWLPAPGSWRCWPTRSGSRLGAPGFTNCCHLGRTRRPSRSGSRLGAPGFTNCCHLGLTRADNVPGGGRTSMQYKTARNRTRPATATFADPAPTPASPPTPPASAPARARDAKEGRRSAPPSQPYTATPIKCPLPAGTT